MDIRIALAGNPNSGKTTLFNALTGSNQFVGNWPGVTVEKKEGKLKKHDNVVIMDLPGIYSLSPYTLEEVVARNYLINGRPDAILNIIDGTNLERNLYLTTQLTELGIPVVVAVNMMDVVNKNGDKIYIDELSRQLGCKVVEISALKGTGIMEAAEEAIRATQGTKTIPQHSFSGAVEHAIAHIEEAAVHGMPAEQQRSTILRRISGLRRQSWTTMQRASSPMSAISTSPPSSRAAARKRTQADFPPPIKSIGSSQTVGWRCRFLRRLCLLSISFPSPQSADGRPIGQTTASLATDGICLALVLLPMRRRPKPIPSPAQRWRPLSRRRKRRGSIQRMQRI